MRAPGAPNGVPGGPALRGGPAPLRARGPESSAAPRLEIGVRVRFPAGNLTLTPISSHPSTGSRP